MEVAFAMVMGPGEAEMAIDNLEAVSALYPHAQCWVRDDATTDGSWERVEAWSTGKRVNLSRNPSKYGYAGLDKSVAQLFLEVASSRPRMVIKIDPDTVLLGQGLDTLMQAQFQRYGNGMCGSYRHSPTGNSRSFRQHGLNVLLDSLPIGPKKKQRGLRWKRANYSPFLLRALRNGYRLGEHVQGGLYGVEGSVVERLKSSGFLDAMARGHTGMVREEDVLLSMGVRSVGGTLAPLNETFVNGPTHIQFAPPLNLSRERIFSPELLAVHPVKARDAALRATLREARMARLAGQ